MDKNKRNNIIKAIAAGAVYAVFFKLNSICFTRLFPDSPYNGIISRTIDAIVLVIALYALNKKDILRNKGKGFFGTFAVAGLEIGIIAVSFIIFLFSFTGQSGTDFMSSAEIADRLIPTRDIVLIITEMLLVGITEELISRGIVFGFFHDAFGSSTRKGAYLTAALSGIVFGCFHLLNLFKSQNKQAVFIQVIATACVVFWGAVFLRKRNIFALMILHALTDISSLAVQGYFSGKADIKTVIDSHNPAALLMGAVYVATGIFILRGSKMNYTEEKSLSAPQTA